jgi:predicted ATP-grasp superfamily ATP-dependent carboligase
MNLRRIRKGSPFFFATLGQAANVKHPPFSGSGRSALSPGCPNILPIQLKTILIVASSGRMLAQSAKRAGLVPIVIDLFGDRDTRELALAAQVVDVLAPSALTAAVDALAAHFEISQAVYGSGLESHPASLDFLHSRLPVLGNSPATSRSLHDKRAFFALLDSLGIAHPEVRFEPPGSAADWLLKPYRGEGGAGIVFYDGTVYEEEIYWQRYHKGRAMSVLFLADRRSAQSIGFNRQCTMAAAGHPFAFSGIINHAVLPDAAKRQLHGWLQALTPAYALVGLNSLDFIWDGRQAWVLEINPRPSASLALYDSSFEFGLLALHLAACRGKMPPFKFHSIPHSAYQILHAPNACCVPANMDWPDWAMDRPQNGSLIRAGHPICSIMARANTSRRTMALLRARRRIIFNTINSKIENDAIHSER